MRRRGVWRRARSIRATTFIVSLVVLLAVASLLLPPSGEAQKAASLPRIGFLAPASLSDPRVPPYIRAFQQGLRELGYVEGQNIAFEFRWAESALAGTEPSNCAGEQTADSPSRVKSG